MFKTTLAYACLYAARLASTVTALNPKNANVILDLPTKDLIYATQFARRNVWIRLATLPMCVSVGVVILKRIAATPANPHAGLVTMESVLHQIFADVIKAMKDITKLVLHR
jgi:hypothetical protein